MNEYVRKLNEFKVDVERLKGAMDIFLQSHPFHSRKNQVCLTHRENSSDPYYEGAGSLYDFEHGQFNSMEKEYCLFHESWRNSYLYEVYLLLQEVLSGAVGRVRLMRMTPISCLSLHRDPTLRVHIPIVTNPNNLFVFRDQIPFHMPADGSAYLLDPRHDHTFVNGDKKLSRIHLVASLNED